MFENNKDRLRELAEKWLKKTISKQEQHEFDLWFNQVDDKPQEIGQSKAEYRNYLFTRIKRETGILQSRPVKLWPKIAVVAAAVAAVVFGAWLYISYPAINRNAEIVNQNDVAPGRVGAMLTLANGKTIKLAEARNGELAKEAGVVISKNANGQIEYLISEAAVNVTDKYNILSTANGETYMVILPDKSKVWLNAASSLTYPLSFNRKGGSGERMKRSISLRGEAYFEVAKDKAHPFVVKTSGQEVSVLGTYFNINAYENESETKTTLLEGSVAVTSAGDSKMLVPGQQMVLNMNGLSVQEANTEEAIAWKNGYFRFNSENIVSIMRKLARWYDIEVSFEGNVKSKSFTGKISRSKNISQVLRMLGKTKTINFKVKGREVIVSE